MCCPAAEMVGHCLMFGRDAKSVTHAPPGAMDEKLTTITPLLMEIGQVLLHSRLSHHRAITQCARSFMFQHSTGTCLSKLKSCACRRKVELVTGHAVNTCPAYSMQSVQQNHHQDPCLISM